MSSFTIVPIIALICYIFLLVSFLAAKKDAAIYAFMELLLTMVCLLYTSPSPRDA